MLDQFPTEIILWILSLLNTDDYTHLVLVCRTYRAEYGLLCGSTNLPVRRFTQAVIQNPPLAHCIRSLELYASHCEGKWRNRPPLAPLTDLQDYSVHQDRWRAPWKSEDAWLALLLVQAKDLKRLRIELPAERVYRLRKNSVHFDRVIHWARDPRLGILARLSHVSLASGPVSVLYRYAEQPVPFRRLITFLRIPSLHELHVRTPCDEPRLALQIGSHLPLTHLDLEQTIAVFPSLPWLLKSCSRLELFTLEVNKWHTRNCHTFPELALLYHHLRRFQSSLRHLNLTFASVGRLLWQEAESPQPSFFGSLREFSNFETVHMRWGNPLPFDGKGAYKSTTPLWEILPQSLRHLFIADYLVYCLQPLCAELESLSLQISDSVPLLRSLYVQFAFAEQESGQRCIKCIDEWVPRRFLELESKGRAQLLDLQIKFGALGVDFRVVEKDEKVPFVQDHAIRKTWFLSEADGSEEEV
ncbi:hypothetical protein BP00DRAFT_462853 [Aspergillus indologenus CBS 114.80]|uniref:F-box domain-containing protein n=1 Tax=Aspergillus indologenus CBS 114.80 TaxID=1450541 RepID=A0A2V5IFQ2_9EURO|nr:hypothetical protein BP00DRAFT_462853 [Aspergillus indologenus CBS 114.80]